MKITANSRKSWENKRKNLKWRLFVAFQTIAARITNPDNQTETLAKGDSAKAAGRRRSVELTASSAKITHTQIHHVHEMP